MRDPAETSPNVPDAICLHRLKPAASSLKHRSIKHATELVSSTVLATLWPSMTLHNYNSSSIATLRAATLVEGGRNGTLEGLPILAVKLSELNTLCGQTAK